MSKRSYLWSGATLAMLVLLVSLMVSNRSAEPRYKGKTVTQWMTGLQPGEDVKKNRAIRLMLAELGSNAVPPLIAVLNAGENFSSRLARKAFLTSVVPLPVKALASTNLVKSFWRLAHAGAALQILGQKAAAVIPDLERIVCDPQNKIAGFAAMSSFEAIGPQAIPALVRSLTNAPSERIPWILNTLQNIGGSASLEQAAPILPGLLHNSDPQCRKSAALALSTIKPPLHEVVPILVEMCASANQRERITAINALERFITIDPAARATFVELTRSKDTKTSRMAGAAIWRANQTNSPTNP
jgi:hypothetical protein